MPFNMSMIFEFVLFVCLIIIGVAIIQLIIVFAVAGVLGIMILLLTHSLTAAGFTFFLVAVISLLRKR